MLNIFRELYVKRFRSLAETSLVELANVRVSI